MVTVQLVGRVAVSVETLLARRLEYAWVEYHQPLPVAPVIALSTLDVIGRLRPGLTEGEVDGLVEARFRAAGIYEDLTR